MITKSVINITSGPNGSYVSLANAKTGHKEQAESSDGAKNEIRDTINLGIGLDLAEKLKSAQSSDDLIALLKDGQAQARESVAKFEGLLKDNSLTGKSNPARDYGDLLFRAVRETVVDFLSRQSRTHSTEPNANLSFEQSLSQRLQKLDPDFKPQSSSES